MTRMYQRPGGLTVLVAAAAIGLAACGGSANAPHVASLGNSSGNGSGSPAATGSSAATLSQGNPTQLLNEWAACMRSHGDPSQATPAINAYKDIEITVPDNVSIVLANEAHDSSGPCGSYLTRAQTALGYRPPAPVSMAAQVKYAECMRAHGVPLYPDPNGSSEAPSLLNIGMPLTSPVFLNANRLCSGEYGIHSASAPPPPGIVQVQSAGAPNGTPPSSGGNKPHGNGGAGGKD